VAVAFGRHGDPLWNYTGETTDVGVGDRLCVWCDGCGCFVRAHKLLKLVSIDRDGTALFDQPLVSMLRGWAEA
jgi:hypothetical protein